jgi:hypothetical protein
MTTKCLDFGRGALKDLRKCHLDVFPWRITTYIIGRLMFVLGDCEIL